MTNIDTAKAKVAEARKLLDEAQAQLEAAQKNPTKANANKLNSLVGGDVVRFKTGANRFGSLHYMKVWAAGDFVCDDGQRYSAEKLVDNYRNFDGEFKVVASYTGE